MADPLARPLKWSKNFQVYVEKHNLYDVFQELLKQMIMSKPDDPLAFVRDELQRTAKGIYNPKVFIIGSSIAQMLGQRLAAAVRAKFITLDEIINQSDLSVRDALLRVFSGGKDLGDESSRKLLINTISKRVLMPDCEVSGFLLYGFPQSKAQAICAQQMGLLPRQVFAFLPETGEEQEEKKEDDEEEEEEVTKQQQSATKISGDLLNIQMHFHAMKEIATSYHYDICKIISYEQLLKSQKSDLEAELLACLLTWKPSGAPFVPRIVIMGPPASGKSLIAEYLAGKFSLVNVDWIDLVRGAVRWDDEFAKQANIYLKDLKSMSSEAVKTILTRRLQKEDCEKKGWILHGFPESKKHCQILEDLFLDPNRVFMLSCPQELSASRMAKKKKAVMKRSLEGQNPPGRVNEAGDFLLFPFGANAVAARYEKFTQSLEGIIPHYGNRIIYVDATMTAVEVRNFVETSVLRPPIPQKL